MMMMKEHETPRCAENIGKDNKDKPRTPSVINTINIYVKAPRLCTFNIVLNMNNITTSIISRPYFKQWVKKIAYYNNKSGHFRVMKGWVWVQGF